MCQDGNQEGGDYSRHEKNAIADVRAMEKQGGIRPGKNVKTDSDKKKETTE